MPKLARSAPAKASVSVAWPCGGLGQIEVDVPFCGRAALTGAVAGLGVEPVGGGVAFADGEIQRIGHFGG